MSGIRGNMETWKAADRWLRGRSTDTDSPKVLILKGPSGVGKTSGSYLLARRCKRNLAEFNTCDAVGETKIRNDILEGCCRTAFTSDGCNDSKAGVVLIDDLEAFTPTALKVIGDVILNVEEVTGIICTCGQSFYIPPSWDKSKFLVLKLQALSTQDLSHIARRDPYFAEWSSIELSEFAKRANGDARQLSNLIMIEKLDARGGLKCRKPDQNRPLPQDPFEATQHVLYAGGMTADRALQTFNTEPTPLVEGLVFANYVQALTTSQASNMNTLAMAAKRISTADIMRVGPTRGMSEEGKTLFGGVGIFGGSKTDSPKHFLEMPPKRVKVSDRLYQSYLSEMHGRPPKSM
jgi:hypothetical protein